MKNKSNENKLIKSKEKLSTKFLNTLKKRWLISGTNTILLIAIVNFSLKNIQNPDPQVIPFQNNAISMPNY